MTKETVSPIQKEPLEKKKNSVPKRKLVKRDYKWEVRVCGDGKRHNVFRNLTPQEHFDSFLSRLGPPEPGPLSTPCRLWQGAYEISRGLNYGVTEDLQGKRIKAHVFSYILAYGPVPVGTEVAHLCDNPMCCNPEHLDAETHKQNMGHMATVGRSASGERHPKAKLRPADVQVIAERYGSRSASVPQLAREYGVSKISIRYILTGKNWPKVPRKTFTKEELKSLHGYYNGRAQRSFSDSKIRELRAEVASGKITRKEMAEREGISYSGLNTMLRRPLPEVSVEQQLKAA